MLWCASQHLTTHWCKPEPEHIVLHGKHINKAVLWPQKEVLCIEPILHILPHSCTSVHMNVSSDNHIITFTSNRQLGWNSKQKVGNFKHCHRHYPRHVFLWPQYSSGRLNNIDSCAPLQPNNNTFQIQTLKALNTAVFCHIKMYKHFTGTCCLHHSWSYSVTS